MNIFAILMKNTSSEPRTLAPDNRVPFPADYRGLLMHDQSLCTGCQTCAYVCSPGAIRFVSSRPPAVSWDYLAVQCTYCGRCAAYCPTGALSFEDESVPVGEDKEADYRTDHPVSTQPCSRCGRPVTPLPAVILAEMIGGHADQATVDLMGLCESCRSRETAKRFKDSLTGANVKRGA